MSTALNDSILVRRLRIHEAPLLSDLNALEIAEKFRKYFFHHDLWVRRAIKQVAVGAQVAIVAENVHPQMFPSLPLGSLILKRGSYSHEIEIKNLLVRNVSQHIEIANKLLHKAKLFSQRRGFKELVTLLPAEDTESIRVHLDFGFRLGALEERSYARYGRRSIFYALSLDLEQTYIEDPFDLNALATWILETRYGFQVSDLEYVEINSERIDFFRFYINENFNELVGVGYLLSDPDALLAFDAFIGAQKSKQTTGVSLPHADLQFVFTLDEDKGATALTTDRTFKVYNKSLIRNIVTSLSPVGAFSRLQLGGLLSFLGQRYVAQLRLTDGKIGFVARSGFGLYLWNGTKIPKSDMPIIVFASDQMDHDSSCLYLWGYATIVSPPQPWNQDELFTEWPREFLLWTRGEFEYYVNELCTSEAQRKSVCLLEIDDITIFETPFNATSLFIKRGLECPNTRDHPTELYLPRDIVSDLLSLVDMGGIKRSVPTDVEKNNAQIVKQIISTLGNDSDFGDFYSNALVSKLRDILTLLKGDLPEDKFFAEIISVLNSAFTKKLRDITISISNVSDTKRYRLPEIEAEMRRLAYDGLACLELLPSEARLSESAIEFRDYLLRITHNEK